MTPTRWLQAKYQALRTLTSIVAQVDNWREVWPCYRARGNTGDLPALHFRQGLAIRHRPVDCMHGQFDEVFLQKVYRQSIKEPRDGVVGRQAGTLTLRSMAEGSTLTTAYENSRDEASTASAGVGSFCPQAGQWWGTIADKFTVSTVSLDEVIERCAEDGTVRLVKIDTEGAEADILEGAGRVTLGAIEQFVLEYHDIFCPDALARCERVLTDAGFKYVVRPLAPGLGMLYARNPAFAA
jgi:FkbM family methyltransferase